MLQKTAWKIHFFWFLILRQSLCLIWEGVGRHRWRQNIKNTIRRLWNSYFFAHSNWELIYYNSIWLARKNRSKIVIQQLALLDRHASSWISVTVGTTAHKTNTEGMKRNGVGVIKWAKIFSTTYYVMIAYLKTATCFITDSRLITYHTGRMRSNL